MRCFARGQMADAVQTFCSPHAELASLYLRYSANLPFYHMPPAESSVNPNRLRALHLAVSGALPARPRLTDFSRLCRFHDQLPVQSS